jgi:hypothetical protein
VIFLIALLLVALNPYGRLFRRPPARTRRSP